MNLYPKHLKNRMLFAYEFWRGKSKVRCKPIQIVIGITNACNAKCKTCSRRLMKRKIGFMDFKTLKKIIDESRNYAEFVDFSFDGEALMHPQVFDFIRYCKKNKLLVGTSTNGISLTKEVSKKLLESGIDCIVLSLDAATGKTYKLIKNVDKFDEVLQNISYLLQIKKRMKNPPYIIAQFVESKLNKNEKGRFIKMWKNSGVDDIRIKPCFTFGSDLGVIDSLKIRNKSCHIPWRLFHVYWDGTVVLCCLDLLGETPIGNIKENSIDEIWNSKRMQNFRKLLARGKASNISICRMCNYPCISPLLTLGSILVNDLTRFKILAKIEKINILKNLI